VNRDSEQRRSAISGPRKAKSTARASSAAIRAHPSINTVSMLDRAHEGRCFGRGGGDDERQNSALRYRTDLRNGKQ
jgi:hypothetical protein